MKAQQTKPTTTQRGNKRGGNKRNQKTAHPNKQARRERAEDRQEAHNALTPKKKVAKAGRKELEKMLQGKNHRLRSLAKRRLKAES